MLTGSLGDDHFGDFNVKALEEEGVNVLNFIRFPAMSKEQVS